MILKICARHFHCLIDHIDYIVKLVGVDYVGLGSDFDGIDPHSHWAGRGGRLSKNYRRTRKKRI